MTLVFDMSFSLVPPRVPEKRVLTDKSTTKLSYKGSIFFVFEVRNPNKQLFEISKKEILSYLYSNFKYKTYFSVYILF